MSTYRDLRVWQRGMDLAVQLYAFTSTLPSEERYGLSAQLKRSGVSVPSNVAEGHCRRTLRAFINHVSIAIGSQGEIETLLELCRRLKIGNRELLESCERSAAETGKLLNGLRVSLERSAGRKQALVYSIVALLCGASYLVGSIAGR